MKIERLIAIITILLQREQVTAPELAKRFEVSRRTISRDIENLCKAGIPIVTAQGYNGGISIADGFKIDKSLFTKDELQTIFAGVQSIDSIAGFANSKGILEKLSAQDAAKPKKENTNSQLVVDDFLVINVGSYYETTLSKKIDLLKEAIRSRRLVTFSYYYSKGECVRTIEPYHVVFQWASWYIFGFCMERKAFRLFKLNRLWKLSLQETTYSPREIPQEAEAYRTGSFTDIYKLSAVFDASVKYRLIETYGIDSFSTLDDGSGRLRLDICFENYTRMLEWVLSFGDKAAVLEPKELAEDIKRQAENLLKRYE